MPYLTPESVPAELTARTLLIPDSVQWVAVVMGALLELCGVDNWELDPAVGGVTVAAAVEASIAIFESVTGAAMAKIGSIQMGIYQTVPAGWLLMDGTTYPRADYPELMEVWPDYLQSELNDTFFVPPMQNRFPLGASETRSLTTTGGETDHTLTTNEMPNHVHPYLRANAGVTGQSGSGSYDIASLEIVNTGGQGGDQPHNNLPPYMAVDFYVVAKHG